MNKDSKLYSIGKAAEQVGVKEHTLRFWQSYFPSISYTLGNGNWRYYDQKAIDQFKMVKDLVENYGMKLAGVQRILSASDPNVAEMLKRGQAVDASVENNSGKDDDLEPDLVVNSDQQKIENVSAPDVNLASIGRVDFDVCDEIVKQLNKLEEVLDS